MSSILNATTTTGLAISPDNSGSLQLATNNGTTAVTIDTSQNVGIGTSSPTKKLFVADSSFGAVGIYRDLDVTSVGAAGQFIELGAKNGSTFTPGTAIVGVLENPATTGYLRFDTRSSSTLTERMRIDSSGNLLVGTTNTNPVGADVNGIAILPGGRTTISRMGGEVFGLNRGTDDGILMSFAQAGSTEGNISVSGSTVSYNGGHLSRWSQLPDGTKDDSIVKGTVMSNLDDMCVWEKDGTVLDNEQLNKMKVSDVEGDTNVAGVFVNWTVDSDYGVDDMNIAMTGDMIIRIANGVVVQKGDLLMSAGDGTAKPQGDDIVRSKTIAKVTSNHVTCTYADGSYCVPCVLMAC